MTRRRRRLARVLRCTSMDERKPRKLLVASIGVATIVYAACSNGPYGETSGNLVAPPEDTRPQDGAIDLGPETAADTAVQDSSSKDANDDG